MDRSSRRATSRRPPYALSTSPPPSARESSLGRQSSLSPVLKSHSWHPSSQNGAQHQNAQSVSQNHSQAHFGQSRRSSRPGSQHDMSFTTPEPNRDPPQRRRSRAGDAFGESPSVATTPNDGDPDDAATKGGHSLRKRARVNYATEHIEDEVTVPNSSSASARFKKRRSDGNEDDTEDIYGPRPKRRGASLGLESTPTGRRRNPSRKSAESRAYMEALDDDEYSARNPPVEDEIHDTIQVGSWSMTSSSPSSKSDSKHSTANRSDTPNRDMVSHNHQSASHLPDTPTKTADSAATTLQADSAYLETDQAQDSGADPSEQLQNESFESLRAVPKNTYFPSSSIINKPSIITAHASPPETPLPQQDAASLTQSPGPIKEEVAMDEDAKIVDERPEDEIRASTPILLDPQLTTSDDKGKDTKEDVVVAAEPLEEAQSPPPKPSVEDMDMEDAPSNVVGEEKTTEEEAPAAEPPSSDTAIQASQPEPEKPFVSARTETQKPTPESLLGVPFKEDSVVEKPISIPDPRWCRPQPTPLGKYSHLTPYVNGEFSVYPEKKPREEDEASEDQSPEDKDSNKESNDVDGAVDDNDDGADAVATELPTPALNTPTRGSPVPEAIEITALNSPMPGGEEPEDPENTDSQDPADKKKHWRYRKLRDPEEFITVIEDYDNMKTSDLFDMLQAVNVSLAGWQDEWSALGKVVDDFENASRRRIADSKYETRTKNLHQHGVNHEEPEFAVRGYKAKEKETMSETRYLQAQDRIMAAAYGFEYDPHPSKIGRQNPETQQAGVTTRGRSLRNQPRQTAKATEADGGVTGKRQRKAPQLFDPAPQEASRASTPVPPTRGRRRKNANLDEEEAQPSLASSFNEPASDVEATGPGRRKRGRKAGVPRLVEDYASSNGQSSAAQDEGVKPTGRRGRNRAAQKEEESEMSFKSTIEEPQPEQNPKRRMLVLKLPKGKNLSEPSSAITDNGDSRPSTASSDSTTQTAESSYSFRPKRQKRFRDEPDEQGAATQQPPKKRNRRTGPADQGDEMMTAAEPMPSTPAAQSNGTGRKGIKIKTSRPPATPAPESRNGTPASQGNEGTDDQPKEYRAMTKSEKMSASMKNRWANGNMAGAVEKRKATLAAKKAAQAAAEQRVGPIAPKPKTKPSKKEPMPLPGENPAFMHAHPPPHAHYQPHPHPHHHPHPHAHQGPPPPPPPPHPHHPHQPHPHQHPHHPHHPHRDYPGVGAPFHS